MAFSSRKKDLLFCQCFLKGLSKEKYVRGDTKSFSPWFLESNSHREVRSGVASCCVSLFSSSFPREKLE
jgi:hypothetical protein